MPTRKTNPLALDILEQDNWRHIEGQDVQQVYDATAEAFEKIRGGGGPFFFWIKMERLSSHTSSDDQKLYRPADELRDLEKSDPPNVLEGSTLKEGVITQEGLRGAG
jgi:Pyruvate/2-oxoglutarate dehydrogenase complex, dehydrogenase (E1) component, eukaryotic type, alpha subunit